MSDSEKNLVDKLKSANTSDVYDALLKIRKNYVRHHHKMKKLQEFCVIELIVPFLEHPKFCNVSLSIIADGCLELSFVNEVIKCNGLQSLMRIMKSFVNDDIQNRACRALGNMAKFEVGFKAVHLAKPVSNIVNFLSQTSDVNCQQTAIRTLMILGKNSKSKELIAQENGIVHIAKLLQSSNIKLLISSIKAIASLTYNCSISCARQLLELHLLNILVKLHSHAEKSVRNNALISLKNLSALEEIRSGLVKVGAVKIFTEVLSSSESDKMCRLAALALCSFLDHIHMWSLYGTDRAVGLKALLVVLQSEKFQDIHINVITSLIPLAYESKVSNILLDLDVLQILIKMLELFIERHQCKIFQTSLFMPPDICFTVNSVSDNESEEECLSKLHHNLTCNIYPKYNEETGSEISVSQDGIDNDFEKSDLAPDLSPKTLKCSKYKVHSVTSDYSSSCSPNRMYSPTQKSFTSQDVNYEFAFGSPSSGICSPVSAENENFRHSYICWSPVVSVHSDISVPEIDAFYKDEDDDASELSISPIKSPLSPKNSNESLEEITCLNSDFIPCSSKADQQMPKLKNKSNFEDIPEICPEYQSVRKKLKTENTDKNGSIKFPSEICNNLKVSESHGKDNSSKECLGSSSTIERTEKLRIDRYVLYFIRCLSFHLEKKTNSLLADKHVFSVLIDYLCLIHCPSGKAEMILMDLIKNRYSFEKLILNGFISELEEKMTTNFCIHRAVCVKVSYNYLLYIGQTEIGLDFITGTLSHILASSEKVGQLYAICAVSKLITEKRALHQILFQANGLSLMCSFLSDNNVTTRRKIVVSLCELYQSLIKGRKRQKCCFAETCFMKTSQRCFYNESFFNITFSVTGGGKILANKEKICKNSDYFRALLGSDFMEKDADEICLSDISAENLSTIFHFLHGCGTSKCCPYIKRIPFSVLLELLSDCDRFLLLNIKTFIEDRLCHHLLPSTVPKIYCQSKFYNSPALTKKTLDFALNLDTGQKDVLWHCFEELLNVDSNFNFLNDVESIIKSLF